MCRVAGGPGAKGAVTDIASRSSIGGCLCDRGVEADVAYILQSNEHDGDGTARVVSWNCERGRLEDFIDS